MVATDATVITVNGKQEYIRNFSTVRCVLYRAMKDKTLDTMHKIRFLEKYTGILVHDHETALYHFGTDHGECMVRADDKAFMRNERNEEKRYKEKRGLFWEIKSGRI